MSVTKLATEARNLSRQIFASLPFGLRVGYVIAHILKLAFQDELPSFGVAILTALNKAGIKGEVGRSGIRVEDMTRAQLNSSKAMKPAMELAKRVYAVSGVKSYDPTYIEEGIWKIQDKLLRGQVALDAFYTVDQAISYIAKALRMAVNDVRKVEERRQEIRHEAMPDYEDILMGNPKAISQVPPQAWKEFLRKVERNPAYKRNEQGVNYVLLWLDEVSQGSNTGHGAVTEVARNTGVSDVTVKNNIKKNQDQLKKDFEVVLKYMEGE